MFSCTLDQEDTKTHLVFRYNEHSDITSLDPAFAKDQRNIWPVHQLYNTLVGLDENLNTIPELAQSWNISEDGKIYTFYLRTDVLFHKNRILHKDTMHYMDAFDVKYSLKRLKDESIASPGSWIMDYIDNIEVIDDKTLQVTLKQNFPAFLGLLSMKYCSVVPEEIEIKQLDFRTQPIGTGPFQFKRWIPQEKLVLRKNPNYFEKDSLGHQLPYLEAIAITFLPDKQSEFMQFIQGNLDFLSGIDVSYKDELLNADGTLKDKYIDHISIEKSPFLNTEYIGFYLNDNTSAINNVNLRKAINYGIDRKKMIKYLRNGIGIPAENGFIPKGLPGHSKESGYRYDKALAKSYLENYKSETGDNYPNLRISTNASYVDIIGFIQAELQSIGIKIEIDVMPPSTLRLKRSAGQLEAFRSSWIADYPDAQNYLSLFYSKNKSPRGPNYTHFDSNIYDSLYKKTLLEYSSEKREQLYTTLDSILTDKAPVIPLFYDEVLRFRHKNVKGLGINPINLLDIKRVRKDKPK